MQGDGNTQGSEGVTSVAPRPPSDTAEPDAEERREIEVAEMVQRCLDPAMGVCVGALDPDGMDPTGREESRRLVMRALGDCARRRVSADDDSVRAVMGRACELGIDTLLGNPGTASVPPGVDLQGLLAPGLDANEVAPSGCLSFAVLLDAVAASRAADRQVAFMVLAASIDPSDACILLGMDPDDLDSSLQRIGRRLSEGHSGPTTDRDIA